MARQLVQGLDSFQMRIEIKDVSEVSGFKFIGMLIYLNTLIKLVFG